MGVVSPGEDNIEEIKSEIRISKSEAKRKPETQNLQPKRPPELSFLFSSFEFVSDFEIRISDFSLQGLELARARRPFLEGLGLLGLLGYHLHEGVARYIQSQKAFQHRGEQEHAD